MPKRDIDFRRKINDEENDTIPSFELYPKNEVTTERYIIISNNNKSIYNNDFFFLKQIVQYIFDIACIFHQDLLVAV